MTCSSSPVSTSNANECPLVKQVVQGADKGVGSLKDPDQGKVVGKVMLMQIPTSLSVSITTASTTTTSRPITKGIVIRQSVGDQVQV